MIQITRSPLNSLLARLIVIYLLLAKLQISHTFLELLSAILIAFEQIEAGATG